MHKGKEPVTLQQQKVRPPHEHLDHATRRRKEGEAQPRCFFKADSFIATYSFWQVQHYLNSEKFSQTL